MYAAPPVVETEVFARLPDEFRKSGHGSSEWFHQQPARLSAHSLLEGPSFDIDGNLYCVDIPWGRIFKVDPRGDFSLVAEYDGEPNGLKIHKDGRIFIADYRHGIMVMDPDTKVVKPFLQRVRLEHLKAVNDLFFGPDGSLYFTDQGLTGLQDPTGRVFRVKPDGSIDCLLNNVPSPNGLVMDPGGTTLYVAATRGNAIWRVPLMRDGTVAKVGIFIQMSGGGGPDGLAVDEAGNLAVAHVGIGAVWQFSKQGEPIARIQSHLGHHTTNVAYGGPDRTELYITESESGTILKAKLSVPGQRMFSGV